MADFRLSGKYPIERHAVKMCASWTINIFGRLERCCLLILSSPGALYLNEVIVLYTSMGGIGFEYLQAGLSLLKSAVSCGLQASGDCAKKFCNIVCVSGAMLWGGGGPILCDQTFVICWTISAKSLITAVAAV